MNGARCVGIAACERECPVSAITVTMSNLETRKDIPALDVDNPDADAELLVLSWGSTWGVAQQAIRQARAAGKKVAHAHLVHVNPFPANLGEVLAQYPKVLIHEMNLGQLVRAEYLVDAKSITKVQGLPFRAAEIEAAIVEMI